MPEPVTHGMQCQDCQEAVAVELYPGQRLKVSFSDVLLAHGVSRGPGDSRIPCSDSPFELNSPGLDARMDYRIDC